MGGGGGLGVNFFSSKIQTDLVCELLNEWHMPPFLGSGSLGPWGRAKRSNIIKSELQSQFQRFLNQTLCTFSQMKDIKHISLVFRSASLGYAQGWDLGVPWGGGGWGSKKKFSKLNQIWCVSYSHE